MLQLYVASDSYVVVEKDTEPPLGLFRGPQSVEHYENTPMQYTEIFSAVKIGNLAEKKKIILILLHETYIVGTR